MVVQDGADVENKPVGEANPVRFDVSIGPQENTLLRIADGGTASRYDTSEIYTSVHGTGNIVDQSRPVFQGERAFAEIARLYQSNPQSLADLQAGFDRILASHGLPPVRIRPMGDNDQLPNSSSCAVNKPEINLFGQYLTGQGTLLMRDVFATNGTNPNLPRLLSQVAHEITHHEQTVLMTRAIIQDVAAANSNNLIQDVQSRFKEIMGADINPDFLKSVLDASAGKPLTPAERQRADALINAEKERMAVSQDNRQLVSRKSQLDDLQCRLENSASPESNLPKMEPSALARLLLLVADSVTTNPGDEGLRETAQLYFGTSSPDPTALRRAIGDPESANFDPVQAREAMIRLLSQRRTGFDLLLDRGFTAYTQGPLEAEAFFAQRLILARLRSLPRQ